MVAFEQPTHEQGATAVDQRASGRGALASGIGVGGDVRLCCKGGGGERERTRLLRHGTAATYLR
jgi:hypothetical protein